MSLTFSDLVSEVRARTTLNKTDTQFITTIKNTLNSSLFRVSREANWRCLRREATFETTASYTTGSGACSVTNNSKNVTITGATLLTDGIQVGQRIQISGSSKTFTIKTITGETTLTLNVAYDGTTSSTRTYTIFGRETYNLPIQSGRIYALWHEDFGYPFVMRYIKSLDFYSFNESLSDSDTPTLWRQWGVDSVLAQPKQAGVLSLTSSSSSDTSINVTVYGTVSGYPDYETITTNSSNGTTASVGSKSFSEIERIVKETSSVGRLTLTADSGNTTVGVLPVGDREAGLSYLKVQIFPFPSRVFPITVLHYKDPSRMVLDRDVHELGAEFDEAILHLTCSKLSYAQSKDEGDKFLALYADEIKNLKKYNSDVIVNRFARLRPARFNTKSVAGTGSRYLGYQQLGGNYGPMSY